MIVSSIDGNPCQIGVFQVCDGYPSRGPGLALFRGDDARKILPVRTRKVTVEVESTDTRLLYEMSLRGLNFVVALVGLLVTLPLLLVIALATK